ncbi:MAG: WYL domain-containing protein [Cellulomonadaceae bacterium]|jgi:proteasome accessory factor C|nr:WYL domain-containing protein [Cellulomonadaceae bacterium]
MNTAELRRYSGFDRRLAELALIDAGSVMSVKELAEKVNASEDVVIDDLRALATISERHFPSQYLLEIDLDALKDEGMVVPRGVPRNVQHLHLSQREASTMSSVLNAFSASWLASADDDLRSTAQSALAKLTEATQCSVRDMVRIPQEGSAKAQNAVVAAIRDRQRIEVRYVNEADHVRTHELTPVRVVTQGRRAYLRAWLHRADGTGHPMTLRVDRVLEAKPLETCADPEDVNAVDADINIARASAAAQTDATMVTITLETTSRWLTEELPVESRKQNADGSTTVTLRVAYQVWFDHLLLAQAPNIRKISPAAVTAQAAQEAKAALAQYALISEQPGTATR